MQIEPYVRKNEIEEAKLKNIIQEKDFIKKIITFDKIQGIEYKTKYLDFDSIVKSNLVEI